MIVIGEKINTTRREVAEAVKRGDASFIRSLARRQADAGAKYIDVNCGSGDLADREAELLPWLVKEVQEELDGAALCIDSNSPEALEAALKVHQGKALLNASYSGEKVRYEALEPLIQAYRCGVVCLCIDDEHGIPATSELRFQIAQRLIERLGKLGVEHDDIFIDPLVQPISVDKKNGRLSSDTIRMIKDAFPAVHTVCGLSNISFELPERKLLNQAFMMICATCGLDAVIMNPEDRAMMRLVYATDTLLGNDNYCKKYIRAYRIQLLIDYYLKQMEKLNIPVKAERATAAGLLEEEYDAVIVAAGAKNRKLRVPGIQKPLVCMDLEFCKGTVEIKDSVVIVGGGVVAAEIAVSLAQKGKKVTLTTRRGSRMGWAEVGSDAASASWQKILALLAMNQVDIRICQTLQEVTDDGIITVDPTGKTTEIKADNVIISPGYEPDNVIARQLKSRMKEVYIVGDAVRPRLIGDAIHEGWAVANQI